MILERIKALARRRPRLAALGALMCFGVAADLFLPPPLHRADDLSVIVEDRNGATLNVFATSGGRWRFKADLDAIDPDFVADVVAMEDQRFWRHWGVDPLAVARAGKSAASAGRIVSGASTITMQTARLLEPRPRNLGSKFIEAVRAAQIERRLSKREILELYLTLAPYGGAIEGVRAASLFYFDKEPAALSPAERALLIALPQSPEARRPDRRPEAAMAARNTVLQRLAAKGRIDAAEASEATGDTVRRPHTAFARIAYHATSRLASEARGKSGARSTLDFEKQATAERIVAARAESYADGATAAAMVVDAATGEVLASVGSSSLDVAGGWIDLTARDRSPGSLLKPFIYAFAFEDGAADEDTVIDDMPRGFGGYRPENFDRTFRGEVRVRDALQHSLNIPAVAALERVGAERFGALLAGAGAPIRRSSSADDRSSLALALGGGGLTMRDVATLYTALADEGRVKPLVWRIDDARKPASQLFAADTAHRIGAILKGAPALEGRAPAALSDAAPAVAYKTGTSYGYRDAWAAGFADGLVIVAWVGRADGAPRPGATGRSEAAPILFDLFDAFASTRALKIADADTEALTGLANRRMAMAMRASPPTIEFPAPGTELFLSDRSADAGVALAASGGVAPYRWYVDGAVAPIDDVGGRALWRPARAGFYDIAVVDSRGVASSAKVRVAAIE
jgi:penicillin-binding protein 1C